MVVFKLAEFLLLTRTTTQLLESLKEASNDGLWRLFDERYRPVLEAFAHTQGLSLEDAAEVAQQTLVEFAEAYREGDYDRSRGRLSSWMLGIARNRVIDRARSRQRERMQRGESALVQLADEPTMTRDWEAARQRVVFQRALEVLRSDTRLDERTIRAFELCALRNAPAHSVADQCGMTVAEVYVAKNRAIRKLRDIVAEFTREYDDQ